MEYGAGTAGNHSGEEHRYQGSSEAWFLGRKHSRSNSLLFSKAHAHVRLNALSAGLSPGSKKTFGGSSQNRYTFSICATLPSISSVNLVHFRFVVHFTDLCKSKNDGPDRQRKHHNCKKGPETPKKTLTKNINSMYRPIGEQTLESTEGGTT